ncbi:hypothetical protein C8F04DRAFT_1389476 [Mycena alexandri]|uniref:RING-type domain-containing protein n=1 Tax=Mycena alexandri TaxID=1745969 RepID=A0AAD6TF90_9AGAR|nr:hypothetical protein C8F04DRAFT_1389476 [Mycena alexandri]
MPFNNDECYCAICDMYFSSLEQRMEHIQATPTHPECDYCKRRFLNKNILRNHFLYSRHHHYCASCEIEFQTPAGLRYHIEHAAVHCDDSDEEDEDDRSHSPSSSSSRFPSPSSVDAHEALSSLQWQDEMGQLMYPDEPESTSDDEDSDDSYEAFDDYDYEDAEELRDPALVDNEDHADDECEDENEKIVPQFSCPLCFKAPESVCCAPCGHIFCSPCITHALKHTNACPLCSEVGEVEQLRKIFLA